MRVRPRLALAAIAAALLTFAACLVRAADTPFPPGAVVVNVTQAPFLADPTGVADSTAAIQLAIHRASQDGVAGDGIADDGTDDGWQDGYARSRPRVIYFPAGVYRLTGSLVGPALDNAQAGGFLASEEPGKIEYLRPRVPTYSRFSSRRPTLPGRPDSRQRCRAS